MSELKLINGKKYSFADVILSKRKNEQSIIVSTFGISAAQIQKLLFTFNKVQVVIDESHSNLNEDMFNRICNLNNIEKRFILKVTSIHAKIAIFGNQCIVTSANLTSNQKIESYLFSTIKEITGVKKIIDFFNTIPEDSFLKDRAFHKNIRDTIDDGIDDFNFNLDLDFNF